jgi:prepilin-type N-terminal cleavage/methylation domain-containing protein
MPRRPRAIATARGFTFIEVMFAVLVLGVGVIMIAAMLPVAIRQARDTRDNAAGASIIEAGFHLIEQANVDGGQPFGTTGPPGGAFVHTWPALDGLPLDGVMNPFQDTFGNRVATADPNFMWHPFVFKLSDDRPAYLAMVGVRSRGEEAFPTSPGDPTFAAFFDDRTGATNLRIDDNYPLPVFVTTRLGSPSLADAEVLSDDDFTVRLTGRSITDTQVNQALVEGAAVVVVDNLGRLRVYRVGVYDEEQDDGLTYYLAPDGDLDRGRIVAGGSRFGSPEEVVDASGYLIGRPLEDPTNDWDADDNPHVGPSQVVRVLDGRRVN